MRAFLPPLSVPSHRRTFSNLSPQHSSLPSPPTALFGFSRAERRARAEAARRRLWERIADLRREERLAASEERFRDAARHRDRAQRLERQDAYIRLQMRLDKAVREERFAEAARVRDVMKGIGEPPIVLGMRDVEFEKWRGVVEGRVSCVKVVRGVCVELESFYDVERSGRQREGGIAVFGVRVRVTNGGDELVQILGRRWCIENFVVGGEGKEVEGCGVGRKREMPVLEGGEAFVFETAVPIRVLGRVIVGGGGERCSVVGSVKGSLEFCSGIVGEERWEAVLGECFLVLPE